MATPTDLLALANSQAGKRYIWGAKPAATEADPTGFDCSGFTNWVCERLGLPSLGRFGGTWASKAACAAAKTLIPIDQALKTPGALLGMDYPKEQHIAFSRGDGTTAEARGAAYGVGSWTAKGRPWNWGAFIPGLSYSAAAPTSVVASTITEYPGDNVRCITLHVPGLDHEGHGDEVLDGRDPGHPVLKAGTVVSVRFNTAGHEPADFPRCVGDQDYAGFAQLQFAGPANFPAFDVRVWSAG